MKNKIRFLAMMLIGILLSVNQVWGTDVSFNFKELQATSGTVDGITWGTGKTGSASATICNATNGLVLYGVSGGGGYFNTTSATSGKITKVVLETTAKKNTPKYTAYGSTDGSNWTSIETNIGTGSKTLDVSGSSYTYFKIANTTNGTAQLGVTSITITYSSASSKKTVNFSGQKSGHFQPSFLALSQIVIWGFFAFFCKKVFHIRCTKGAWRMHLGSLPSSQPLFSPFGTLFAIAPIFPPSEV